MYLHLQDAFLFHSMLALCTKAMVKKIGVNCKKLKLMLFSFLTDRSFFYTVSGTRQVVKTLCFFCDKLYFTSDMYFLYFYFEVNAPKRYNYKTLYLTSSGKYVSVSYKNLILMRVYFFTTPHQYITAVY